MHVDRRTQRPLREGGLEDHLPDDSVEPTFGRFPDDRVRFATDREILQ